MDPLRPGDPPQVGKYRLAGRLGEGGMGQVFFGRSPGGRAVAVKVIRSEYAHRPQFRARFAREVEAARRVGGFHTALVVDADPEADPPWMATAYIPGPSLYRAVAAHGALELPAVRTLGAGLAEGLAAIHECGLVHRDFKPHNVILAVDGPRIIDFGIARLQDATEMTTAGTVLGTYAYMSPEQVNGQPAGPASDVFSFGAVLAFAATGRNAFGNGTIAAVLHRIAWESPDLRDVPAEDGLRDLIAACLAKEPPDRPALPDILGRLAGPWPSGDWLPAPVMSMIASRAPEPGDSVNAPAGGSDHGFHKQTTAAGSHGSTADRPVVTGRSHVAGAVRGRLRHPAVLIAGLVACVLAVSALVVLLMRPESPEVPTASELPASSEPPAPSGQLVTDDGRAFGPGGWSQFTVTISPANTGVRLTRRFDSGVLRQSASISVNGVQAGRWAPLDGVLNTWMNQTVALPPALTKARGKLTVRNTFESSSRDFNEFTYLVEQRINGAWVRADVVDVGPGHLADERAHDYRVTKATWEGAQTFGY